MLHPSTLNFLIKLNLNNNRTWFEEHRKNYETAKADFTVLVERLIDSIASFDPPIGQLSARECMFRINRDVRFSKDKRPYKNNFAAYFNESGKKSKGAGYYLHVEPGHNMVAGGIWMPEAPVLASIRQEIDYNIKDFEKILNDRNFKQYFSNGIESESKLLRPPKGYDENNPAIEYLKMKSFIVSKSFTDEDLFDKTLVKNVSLAFKKMKPLLDFINTALH